jgi:hypothetical protein
LNGPQLKHQKSSPLDLESIHREHHNPRWIVPASPANEENFSHYTVTGEFPRPNPITFDHAENFVLAAAHARRIGKPLEHHLTIKWPDQNETGFHHKLLLNKISEWLSNNVGVAAFIWAKETTSGDHSHFLMHIDPGHSKKLRVIIRRWLKADYHLRHLPIGMMSLTQIDTRLDPDRQIRNRLRYLLKGAEYYTRIFFGCPNKPDTGIVAGKRCGWSQALGDRARQCSGGVVASGHRKIGDEMIDAILARDRILKLEKQ